MSKWLNNLYHLKSGNLIEGVDLSTPLTYADRFRIRHPGGDWNFHPPHVDGAHFRYIDSCQFEMLIFVYLGGSIERWEDQNFRTCFEAILSGNWREHDPFDLEGRLNARSSMYGRPNQVSQSTTPLWVTVRSKDISSQASFGLSKAGSL